LEQATGRPVAPVRRLTVLYDERCERCRRWSAWLARQRSYVPVELLPADSPAASVRYPYVRRWLGRELVVVDDRARAWVGPPASVMCLWATVRHRWAASFATRPLVAPVSDAWFRHYSAGRHRRRDANDDLLFEREQDDACACGVPR
jgi:predicted DCC family thiol-disulfide oxidoreductase YuxK